MTNKEVERYEIILEGVQNESNYSVDITIRSTTGDPMEFRERATGRFRLEALLNATAIVKFTLGGHEWREALRLRV